MKFSKLAADFCVVMETAMGKVLEKTESFDDAIEKRKMLKDAQEEFTCISMRVVENLMDLTKEEIEGLPEVIKSDVKALEETLNVISKAEEEMMADKGLKCCKNCEEVIDDSVKFCPECGANQNEEVEEDASEE